MSKWILLLLLTVALISAQVLYGTLTGTVTDASGAPIPSAKISAVNTGTGITRETATDERGNYVFTDLQAGTYKVTIAAPSFRTVVEQGTRRSDANSRCGASMRSYRYGSAVEQTLEVNAATVSPANGSRGREPAIAIDAAH